MMIIRSPKVEQQVLPGTKVLKGPAWRVWVHALVQMGFKGENNFESMLQIY